MSIFAPRKRILFALILRLAEAILKLVFILKKKLHEVTPIALKERVVFWHFTYGIFLVTTFTFNFFMNCFLFQIIAHLQSEPIVPLRGEP